MSEKLRYPRDAHFVQHCPRFNKGLVSNSLSSARVKTPAEEANRWKKVGETRVSGYKSAEFSKQMSCWTGAFRLAGQDKEAPW
jgi:hypothetical protein